MPLPEELRKSLDSDIADLQNIGDRYGGMLVAGLFLKEFVPDGIPWAHLDVAGPAWNQGERPRLHPEGRHRRAGPDPRRVARPRRARLLASVRRWNNG